MSCDLGKIGTLAFNKQRYPDFAFKRENPDPRLKAINSLLKEKRKIRAIPTGFHKNTFTFLKKCIKYAT
jgi:hypothetical protein